VQALLQDFLPWLVGFYLLDAVASVARGQSLYAAPLAHWRRLGPGIHWAGLLPTSALVAVLEAPPLARAGMAWVLGGGPRYDPPVVRPDDLEAVPLGDGPRVEGSRVLAGKRLLAKAPTPAHAAALVRRLGPAGPGPAPDLVALRERLRLQAPWTAALRALSTALFLLLFAALPAAAFGARAGAEWLPGLLVASGGVHLAVLVAGAGLLARSGLRGTQVAARLASMAAWPVYTAHALSHLLRDAFAEFDPAFVAAALLGDAPLRAVARRELVRAAAAREASSGRLAEAWAERERAWREALGQAGIPLAEVLAPPPRVAGADAYCPACTAAYTSGREACADCGLPLARWSGSVR